MIPQPKYFDKQNLDDVHDSLAREASTNSYGLALKKSECIQEAVSHHQTWCPAPAAAVCWEPAANVCNHLLTVVSVS